MSDAIREALQFLIGGGAFIIAIFELIRRVLRERPRLKFTVTGRAHHTRVQPNYYIHQIQIRVTNQSRLDNSVSECWLQYQSQTARPPTCNIPTSQIDTVTDGKRVFRTVFPNFEVEPSTIGLPIFVKAHDTIEGYVVFSTHEKDLDDIIASEAKYRILRIKDAELKWYEYPVSFSKPGT